MARTIHWNGKCFKHNGTYGFNVPVISAKLVDAEALYSITIEPIMMVEEKKKEETK